jgi:glycosyltransferase involved in cell wall biosynthesis
LLPFHINRKFKLIYWTIGVSADYDKRFDYVKQWDFLRDFIYKRADALIFYTDIPIKKYIQRGYLKDVLFVAPNTVEVYKEIDKKFNKDRILFIGTLYKQKGIIELLNNYKIAYNQSHNILPLYIIGGGDEFDSINEWIKKNGLYDKVILTGPIFDPITKASYFQKSFACISPLQAGLSVLESMGYGVPFVTMFNSFTGGERFNIIDGVNGILMENLSQLKDIIIDISGNKDKYIKLGNNALEYYLKNTKPEDMVDGLSNAIDFVLT